MMGSCDRVGSHVHGFPSSVDLIYILYNTQIIMLVFKIVTIKKINGCLRQRPMDIECTGCSKILNFSIILCY